MLRLSMAQGMHVTRRDVGRKDAMSETTKLALAVVVAAVILIGGYVAYSEFARARDVDQAQQSLDAFRQHAQETVADARRVAQVSQDQQTLYQRREWERRRLAANQRCVGGSVVEIQGSVYTQLGSIADPIHCSGDVADRPLR